MAQLHRIPKAGLKVVVITGLLASGALLLALAACISNVTSTPDHIDAPGTTGEVLQQKLEEKLPLGTPSGHAGDEGIVHGSEQQESVYAGARSEPSTPVREYSVVAINVESIRMNDANYDA